MGYLSDYEKKHKITTPTGVKTGGYLSQYEAKQKTNPTKPTPTPAKAAPVPVKPVQQPTNFLQSAVEGVKKVASNAINSLTKNSKLPGNQPIVPKPTKGKTLDLGGEQPSSAQMTITPLSIKHQQNVVDTLGRMQKTITNIAPGTSEYFNNLGTDPLHFNKKLDLNKVIPDGINSIKNMFKTEWPKVSEYLKGYKPIGINLPPTTTKDVKKQGEAFTGAANIGFSLVSALFEQADKVPILGAITSLITLPLTVSGEAVTATSNKVIESLPLQKQDKENLKAGITPLLALAAQIYVGGKLSPKKVSELEKQYGPDGAKKLVETATNLSDQKKATNPSTQMSPEDVRGHVQATNLEGTPAGQTLLEAADKAEKEGKHLLITAKEQQLLLPEPKPRGDTVKGEGFSMSDKPSKEGLQASKSINEYRVALDSYNKNPTPAKLKKLQELRQTMNESKNSFTGKTDGGTSFKIDLVEPKKIQALDEGLAPIESSVVQYVNEKTGAKEFKTIPKGQLEDFKSAVDNSGGTVVKDGKGNTVHLTAKTPEQMTEAGFKDAGVADVKEVPKPQEAKPKTETPKAPSKIAKSIERKAIEEGLTKGFENIAGYDKITIKDQAAKAEKLFSNIDEAKSVVRGEKPLPEGLRGTSVITAAEEYIKKTGDGEFAYELANSPLVSETSLAAQELRLAAERQPDSLVAKLRELRKIREETAKKRTGQKMNEAIKSEVVKIKRQVKLPDRNDWGNFVSSIQC